MSSPQRSPGTDWWASIAAWSQGPNLYAVIFLGLSLISAAAVLQYGAAVLALLLVALAYGVWQFRSAWSALGIVLIWLAFVGFELSYLPGPAVFPWDSFWWLPYVCVGVVSVAFRCCTFQHHPLRTTAKSGSTALTSDQRGPNPSFWKSCWRRLTAFLLRRRAIPTYRAVGSFSSTELLDIPWIMLLSSLSAIGVYWLLTAADFFRTLFQLQPRGMRLLVFGVAGSLIYLATNAWLTYRQQQNISQKLAEVAVRREYFNLYARQLQFLARLRYRSDKK